MRLTAKEARFFDRCAGLLLQDEQVRSMEGFVQHGQVSCLEHSLRVARMSFWLCRRLGMRAQLRSLVRGALLHDFFLYDWHYNLEGRKGLHGFTHPRTALENARRRFVLNEREEDIILKHMWPMTVIPPRHCETVVVCLADKYCSLVETLFCRRRRSLPALSRAKTTH